VVGGGSCGRCRRARDQARPSAAARGYGPEWSRLARDWLRHFPWCGQRIDGQLHAEHSRCVQRGDRVRAQCVDHIIGIGDGGAIFDLANLQSLCTSCNVAKG